MWRWKRHSPLMLLSKPHPGPLPNWASYYLQLYAACKRLEALRAKGYDTTGRRLLQVSPTGDPSHCSVPAVTDSESTARTFTGRNGAPAVPGPSSRALRH